MAGVTAMNNEVKDRDARVRRTLREAHRTVERTRGIEPEDAPPPPVEDRFARWNRELRQRELAQDELVHKTVERAPTPATFDWSALDERVMSLIVRDREATVEAVAGEVVALLAEARKDTTRALREQIAELKVEIAKLGEQSAALREQVALERLRSAGVEVLPARRVN
jgi:hypothetical protein